MPAVAASVAAPKRTRHRHPRPLPGWLQAGVIVILFLQNSAYNSQHEPLTITDAAGQVTTLTYNTQGQILTRQVVVNSANQITTMTYTGPGGTGTGNYLTLVTGPVTGATTSYLYDSYGRVHTVTDSEGCAVTTAYDAFDRPTTVTYPDGRSLHNKLPLGLHNKTFHFCTKIY